MYQDNIAKAVIAEGNHYPKGTKRATKARRAAFLKLTRYYARSFCGK